MTNIIERENRHFEGLDEDCNRRPLHPDQVRAGKALELAKQQAPIDFAPKLDYLLVRKSTEKKTTAGGIILPDAAQGPMCYGEVVAAGPGTWQNGTFVKNTVAIGEWVRFGEWVHNQQPELEIGGEKLLLMRESDIIGSVPSKLAKPWPMLVGGPLDGRRSPSRDAKVVVENSPDGRWALTYEFDEGKNCFFENPAKRREHSW